MTSARSVALLLVLGCASCLEHAHAAGGELPVGTCGHGLVQRDSVYQAYFDAGAIDLSPRARAIMDELVQRNIHTGGDGSFVLRGNTDAAEAQSDSSLDIRRADAVRAYLVSHGLANDALSIAGDGATHPFVPTPAGVAEAQNRYVIVFPNFGRQMAQSERHNCAEWIRSNCVSDHPSGSVQACDRAWNYVAPGTYSP